MILVLIFTKRISLTFAFHYNLMCINLEREMQNRNRLLKDLSMPLSIYCICGENMYEEHNGSFHSNNDDDELIIHIARFLISCEPLQLSAESTWWFVCVVSTLQPFHFGGYNVVAFYSLKLAVANRKIHILILLS